MVYVMGEVVQPGSIPMRGQMTVLQALAMAGGFKEFANTKDIRILRKPAGILKTVETIRVQLQRRDQGQLDAGLPVARRHGGRAVGATR